jgi:hypothetical protein
MGAARFNEGDGGWLSWERLPTEVPIDSLWRF